MKGGLFSVAIMKKVFLFDHTMQKICLELECIFYIGLQVISKTSFQHKRNEEIANSRCPHLNLFVFSHSKTNNCINQSFVNARLKLLCLIIVRYRQRAPRSYLTKYGRKKIHIERKSQKYCNKTTNFDLLTKSRAAKVK